MAASVYTGKFISVISCMCFLSHILKTLFANSIDPRSDEYGGR